jgi:acetolactate synthase I/II/III large subunit
VLTSSECATHVLASPVEDCAGALQAVADALSLNDESRVLTQDADRPVMPTGEITLQGLATTVASLLPENAIVVDEAMTSGRGMMAASRGAAPHDWLANTGGSIGIALPLAVGAAIASPNRRVLCLTADGSGMYTLQGLWTMAREGLNVTTVVFANRAYGVLQWEYSGLGVGTPGPRAADVFNIGRPDIDWVSMAKGMGVPAARATSLDALGELLRKGFASEGPSLIEIPL